MSAQIRASAIRGGAATVIVAVLIAGAGVRPAFASTDTFDFGLLAATLSGTSTPVLCTSNCVLPGLGEQLFTNGGVTVGAIGYNASNQVAYVTQKPGAFAANGGETGLGESNTAPTPSDTDYEINRTTWLLIDNTSALAAGYLSSTFSIESMQSGEGANIYAYNGSLTTLQTSQLTLLATLENPNTGASATQTIAVPDNSHYLVVQASGPSSGSDVVVGEYVLNTQSVPEPASIALLGAGIAGLGLLRRRRRTN